LKYTIIPFSEQLYLIGLEPPIPGFGNFISAWVYKGKQTFIVDVGPKVTSGLLLKALEALGVSKLDYIFLTHIHIDHAGGLGDLATRFSHTPIICHEDGIPHLVSPERLYEGSVKTLGKTAEIYGPITPVSENRFIPAQNFTESDILPVLTPGHAPHHVSYVKDRLLFAGEAGGVCLSENDNFEYLRPATPPRFFLETYVKSIDALIDIRPETICYGHFGLKKNGLSMLKKNRAQLFMWRDMISRNIKEDDFDKDRYGGLTRLLLENDPCLNGFSNFNEAVKERERGFIKNAIMGFEGYLKNPLTR